MTNPIDVTPLPNRPILQPPSKPVDDAKKHEKIEDGQHIQNSDRQASVRIFEYSGSEEGAQEVSREYLKNFPKGNQNAVIQNFIDKSTGDSYEIRGAVGAVGPSAHAHNINFTQLWNQLSSEIDLKQLADELSQLRQELKQKAKTLENDMAIGEIAAAEAAAKKGSGAKTLERLKNAGKWGFSVAEKIGIGVATATIKSALRL